MTVTIHGIKTCDTMKKAFAWLDAAKVGYRFHDYRADGISRDDIARWADAVGWEKLLNKSSTTFRALTDAAKSGIDRTQAVDLMLDQPTMIKRPVLETGNAIEVGFKAERYEALFGR
jgi:arsenate reductase